MQAAFTEESMSRQTFNLLGTVKSGNAHTNLISNNTSLISIINIGNGFDTCSFYNGPSEATIIAFGENNETCGSIAYDNSESCGSVAYYSDSESCGSVASSFSGSASSCSYSYCC